MLVFVVEVLFRSRHMCRGSRRLHAAAVAVPDAAESVVSGRWEGHGVVDRRFGMCWM